MAQTDNPGAYDAAKFDRPSVTVDIIIFTVRDGNLMVLLVKRNVWPFKGLWAIPGGFVRMDESLDDAAGRELFEETGVKDVYLEQLYTFGDPKRDPRTRVITVTYFALMASGHIRLNPTTDVSDARWFSAYNPLKLAFDHRSILEYALKRLRWKLEYTTIGFVLIPKKFTLTQLQKTYEIILNKSFDKRNFRKKILSLGIIRPTEESTENVSHRPARLYCLKPKIGDIIEII